MQVVKDEKKEKAGDVVDMSTANRQQRKAFDKFTKDIEKRLRNTKTVSSFALMGIGEGIYHGGLVGDKEVILEMLYTKAKKHPAIFELFEMVVNAIKDEREKQEAEFQKKEAIQNLKADSKISYLLDHKLISSALFNVLDREKIEALEDLKMDTEKKVLNWRGMGVSKMKELKILLMNVGISFKGGGIIKDVG